MTKLLSAHAFNTLLEKDTTKHKISFAVLVLHKNGRPYKSIAFSQSFSIDEIYKRVNEQYPNKNFILEIYHTK